MSITVKLEPKHKFTVRLRRLKPLTVFSVHKVTPPILYLKCENYDGLTQESTDEVIAVNLSTGAVVAIDDDWEVETYEGTLNLSVCHPKQWIMEDDELIENDDEDEEL